LKSSDKSAEPKYNRKGIIAYDGSTAYLMTKLKAVLVDGKLVSDEEYKAIIEGTIAAVDRENSTHLNADKVGRTEISDRIGAI